MGATNATLELTNVTFASSASYSLAVSNAFGGVLSGEASLTVLAEIDEVLRNANRVRVR